jgi:hypothetical protein
MVRAFLITVVVTLALAGALAFVGEPGRWPAPETPPQQGEAVDAASPASQPAHSPAALARLIREPQNTWSNLAFALGGAWLVSAAASRLARLTGVALIGVGIGSFLYHASVARELRHLDVAAMYWVFLMATALCLQAIVAGSRDALHRGAWAILVVTLLLAIAFTAGRNIVVAGMKPFSLKFATAAAAAIIILSMARVAWRRETLGGALQLLVIVTLFGLAAACQTMDRPGGRFFRPGAIVQAHAAWHVLAAVTFVAAARFLDQETIAVVAKKKAGADGPST